MKVFSVITAVTALVFLMPDSGVARSTAEAPLVVAREDLNPVLKTYCAGCHNARLKRGNLSLAEFDMTAAPEQSEIAEAVVSKLRSGMMPPPGSRRPSADTLAALVTSLESQLDEHARLHPNPGFRTFQRMNRAEYTLAIRDLLGLQIDAADYLPPDTKSENFDNIADVQALSPLLLSAYLRAASAVSRLAVGDGQISPATSMYVVPKLTSQTDHVEGAPYGTRGGLSVMHTFPADGMYSFTAEFFHETTGAFAGGLARGEQLEISIDGERKVLLAIDRFMTASDPNGVAMSTPSVKISAGPHRVSAAFVPPVFQGVVQDLISPLKYSLFSTSNATAYGFTQLPHLRDLMIKGPFASEGVSDSHVRQRIFTCRPATKGASETACARQIVSRFAEQAYRRPVAAREINGIMKLYEEGAARDGGFEPGVRSALEAILASPDFVFRFELAPANTKPGEVYKLRDIDLASRLSFFLWSAPPDKRLIDLAAGNQLSQPAVLNREVKRMLADPRSNALATRFAAQWLRLPDLDVVTPDIRQYPDFDEQVRGYMRRETELFFEHIVREDKSVLDLYTADYTFMNERLAEHYGMPNVAGDDFRLVKQTDPGRRGILGQASVLTLTSQATRTSPVERGKWVMEVMLSSPPPPPPPGVPDLDATPGSANGRLLTVRERMEEHRKNPACMSCHKMMDPIGLALEHYDATGRRRVRDNGMPIDSRGELWDGTKVSTLPELSAALINQQATLLRTFTTNLMAYAIGRRVEAHDMPSIRTIVNDAAPKNHRMSDYIMGVINSPAFRMQRAEGGSVKSVTS